MLNRYSDARLLKSFKRKPITHSEAKYEVAPNKTTHASFAALPAPA